MWKTVWELNRVVCKNYTFVEVLQRLFFFITDIILECAGMNLQTFCVCMKSLSGMQPMMFLHAFTVIEERQKCCHAWLVTCLPFHSDCLCVNIAVAFTLLAQMLPIKIRMAANCCWWNSICVLFAFQYFPCPSPSLLQC